MSAAVLRRTDKRHVIAWAGAAVAVIVLALNLGFFFRAGIGDALGGLAHHAFVLGWLLVLTAGSRTVSVPVLGLFWLLGVWGVYGVTYLLQSLLVGVLGLDVNGELVPIWLAPITEEPLKLAPVAIFLLLAARRGDRCPSMSDGLLLGFMIGAGVSFHEDAQSMEGLASGDGWGAAPPWTVIFPTVSPLDDYFALNHAFWGALNGLGVGAAVMLRHRPRAWLIALAGLLLSVTNHVMANHFTTTEFGIRALLNRAGGGETPFFYDALRTLTIGGRLQLVALIAGAVAAVIVERRILTWVAGRDRMFPALPRAALLDLLRRAVSKTGLAQLLAAHRYVRMRRSVYFAGWRAKLAGRSPTVTHAAFDELTSLLGRARGMRTGEAT